MKTIYINARLEPSANPNIRSYKFTSNNRGKENTITLPNEADQVFEFELEDGTLWLCDTNSLDNLFPQINLDDKEEFIIPEYIEFNEASNRGLLKKIAIKLLKLIVGNAIKVGVKELAHRFEIKNLESGTGLFLIGKNFELKQAKSLTVNKPYLLFIHGFSSSIHCSFEDLKFSDSWAKMLEIYGENIIGYQHESLTKSALENAKDLVKLLPNNIELHIVTQSRGGLVGEVLTRYSYDKKGVLGFPNEAIQKLRDNDRTEDIDMIKELDSLFSDKKIYVKKFVRVACPAAGTTLAGERLNVFLNTTLNLLSKATGVGSIAIDILKELIMEVIKTKDDQTVLPGVECMNRQSPFIEVLNSEASNHELDRPLIVITGNRKISLELKGLGAILSKVFFQRRNDFVVDTDSMYMGSKRPFEISYYFIEDSNINHFKYFSTLETQQALLKAIVSEPNSPVPGFKRAFQTLVPASDRADALGLEYGELDWEEPKGDKPIVLLLPGIMGSNLKKGDKKIWIQYLNLIGGELSEMQIKEPNEIQATSLISTSYKKLKVHLSSTYDVVPFAYDWRVELNKSAEILADRVEELLKLNQPIKVVAHSMGGVLFRDFANTQKDTWKKLNDSIGFRMVFLGVPFKGSPRIPFVLLGQDGLINKLSNIDFIHSKKKLISFFTKFRGILNLLPTDSCSPSFKDFSEVETWEELRTAIGEPNWPIPTKEDLEYFKQYRSEVSGFDYTQFTNATYLAGHDDKTPYRYRFNEDGNLVLIYTSQGDASVTWESIPSYFKDSDKLYYEKITHGELANDRDIFKGIEDLLIFGASNLLSKNRGILTNSENLFVSKPDFDFDNSREGIFNSIFGLKNSNQNDNVVPVLEVKVSNSDLVYSDFPVLAGHFLNDGILFAEKVIDDKLNNALTTRNKLGIHVGLIGQSDVLIPVDGEFPGAIIVGMGRFGNLTGTELSKTVELGVCNYLIEIHNREPSKKKIGISSLIIGCNYGGLTVENSALSIIEGVHNANKKIANLIPQNSSSPAATLVSEIEFIERYEDRALSCLYALTRRASNLKGEKSFFYLNDNRLNKKLGSKRRISVESTEMWWERIGVSFEHDIFSNSSFKKLQFNVSTGGARVEQKEEIVNVGFIHQFISNISLANNWNECDKKIVFESLIPHDFKDYLRKKKNIVWLVDIDTAEFPWELLSDNSVDSKPLCINAGMVRQLATSEFRPNAEIISENMAFIAADPPLNRFKGLSQLPGAQAEGVMVQNKLKDYSYNITSKIGASGIEIHKALYCGNYKIIHLAGHGLFNEESPFESGMVLGENHYLSALDISKMSTVPEFVFVNCCYLGQISPETESLFQNRYKIAANMGTQLIQNGVKAVIVAGWAVNDNAALKFSDIFYTKMFEGYSFGEATQIAREALFEEYGYTNNTWGAYQCYGDQFYKFDTKSTPEYKPNTNFGISEEIEIELDNLLSILESKENVDDIKKKFEDLMTNAKDSGLINPKIIEKQALLYAELSEYDRAIDIYDELLKIEKADFSVYALEKSSNIRIKNLCRKVIDRGYNKQKASKEIDLIIKGLNSLLLISKTSERFSLLGSAYKRLALISPGKSKLQYYFTAATKYKDALTTNNNQNNPYPLYNYLIILSLFEDLLISAEDDIKKNSPDFNLLYSDYGKDKKEFVEALDGLIAERANMSEFSRYKSRTSQGNLVLAKLILSDNAYNDDKEWEVLNKSYKKSWKIIGTPDKIAITIENFEIILDIIDYSLKVSTTPNTIEKLQILERNIKNLVILVRKEL